jgi:hypothetical protein
VETLTLERKETKTLPRIEVILADQNSKMAIKQLAAASRKAGEAQRAKQ